MITRPRGRHVTPHRDNVYRHLWEAQRHLDQAYAHMVEGDRLVIQQGMTVRGLWFQALATIRHARDIMAVLLDGGLTYGDRRPDD